MSGEILLKISTPTRVFLEKKVEKVSIPAHKGDLTVLVGRAPSEILLSNGKVKVLNEKAEVLEEYKIGAGIADIAGDVCSIYTEFTEKSTD